MRVGAPDFDLGPQAPVRCLLRCSSTTAETYKELAPGWKAQAANRLARDRYWTLYADAELDTNCREG
jgi:hypothetical protein